MSSIILELEERLRLAMCSSDIATLDNLLSEQLIFTNHFGQLISKLDDIYAHKNKLIVVNSILLSDMRVIDLGSSAVVTAQAEISGSYDGAPTSGKFRFTRVWNKAQGAWKVVCGHSCLIHQG